MDKQIALSIKEAGHAISHAAETMQRAGGQIDASADRLVSKLEEVSIRFEKAVGDFNEGIDALLDAIEDRKVV